MSWGKSCERTTKIDTGCSEIRTVIRKELTRCKKLRKEVTENTENQERHRGNNGNKEIN